MTEDEKIACAAAKTREEKAALRETVLRRFENQKIERVSGLISRTVTTKSTKSDEAVYGPISRVYHNEGSFIGYVRLVAGLFRCDGVARPGEMRSGRRPRGRALDRVL